MGWLFRRTTHAPGNEGSTMALSDLENLVLAELAAHSKPFAGGKGGLDAEEINRAIRSVHRRRRRTDCICSRAYRRRIDAF